MTLAERLVRDPGEAIVDPWVVRRRTLVAVERHRVVAAGHVLRYGARGVGSWLVRAAAPYLRLAGCDRMLVTVALDAERAGAGRFYQRLGLVRLARLDRAWAAPETGKAS